MAEPVEPHRASSSLLRIHSCVGLPRCCSQRVTLFPCLKSVAGAKRSAAYHISRKREREGHLQSRCFWILYLLVDRGMPGKNNMTINDWKALIRRPNLECKGGGLKSSITPNRVPSFKATAFIPWQGKMHNVKVKRRAKKTPSIW